VIEEILEQDLCAKARRLGDYLASRLACLKKLGVVREIRGKGVLRGVELTHSGLGTELKKTALANGIILRIDPSWFAVSPPLIAEEADIDEMCALIEKSLADAIEAVERSNPKARMRV
jgi:4-aminobutyrate aminotransferase-like enzyme